MCVFEKSLRENDYKEMTREEIDNSFYEMFGVDNSENFEYARDCWNND